MNTQRQARYIAALELQLKAIGFWHGAVLGSIYSFAL